jgi:hypothetical protein
MFYILQVINLSVYMSIPEKNQITGGKSQENKGRLWYDTVQYYNCFTMCQISLLDSLSIFKKPEDYMLFVVVF